jgi:hypothetical protein
MNENVTSISKKKKKQHSLKGMKKGMGGTKEGGAVALLAADVEAAAFPLSLSARPESVMPIKIQINQLYYT